MKAKNKNRLTKPGLLKNAAFMNAGAGDLPHEFPTGHRLCSVGEALEPPVRIPHRLSFAATVSGRVKTLPYIVPVGSTTSAHG